MNNNNNKMCPPLPELPSVFYKGVGFVVFVDPRGEGWEYTAFKNNKYLEFKTVEEINKMFSLIEINKKMGPWSYDDETEPETEPEPETKTPLFIFDLSVNDESESEDEDEEPYIPPEVDNKYVNKKVIKFFTPKLFFKKRGDSYCFNYINDNKKKSVRNSDFIINQMFKHFDLCPLTAKNTYIKLIRDLKKKNNTKFINDYHAENIKFWSNKKKTNKFNPSLVK
jgi:hypothetical protein